MERGSRYASPPHNSQEDCIYLSRRKVVTSLSPPRERSRRARVGLSEFSTSDGRRELVKMERYPTISVNKFRRPFMEAERDGEFRQAWNEVAKPDKLISSSSHRGHCRIYSPSRHCNGEEDVCHNYFSPMRNKAKGKEMELTEDNKDNQFASVSREEMVLDGCGMLLEKSIMLEDGTVRTFYLLPPDTSDPLCKPKSYSADNMIGSKKVTPCSTGNADFGSTDSVVSQYGEDPRQLQTDSTYNLHYTRLSHGEDKLQYNKLSHREDKLQYTRLSHGEDKLQYNKLSHREDKLEYTRLSHGEDKLQYDKLSHREDKLQYTRLSHGEAFGKEERDIFNYSRSAAYPFGFPQSKIPAVASDSSSLPRGLSCGEHTNSLHARLEDFCNGKLCEATTSERHRQRDMYSKENSSVRIGNWSSNDSQLYSTRQMHGGEVAACTENIRRDSSDTILMPHDSYNKGQHIPCHNYNDSPRRQESWQCGSVRSHLDVEKTDRMENTANLRNYFIRAKEDMAVQNDPLYDHGDMHGSSSLMAISSGLHGEIFRSRRGGLSSVFRMEVSSSPPTRHAREEYPFRKKASVVDCRKAARNHSPEAAVDLHKSSLSPSSRLKLSIGELDMHGREKRVSKRKHIVEDNHRGGLQRKPFNEQDKSRRLREIDLNDNGWRDEEGTLRSSIRSRRSFHDEVLHRNSDSMSMSVNKSSDMQRDFSKSKPRSKFSNPLKRMKINRHCEDKSDYKNEEQDFHHPYSFQKHNSECLEQDRPWNKYCEKNELVNDRDPVQLSDLPEDSATFKQQVQKAFLRFVKILNENPGEQKRYEEKGKHGSLLCIVCGRLSKDYHSLVVHAFNSKKVGLRAEHLGLHKALCVLMGWNYAVVPNNVNVYQSLAKPDAIAMKEDLILWPPLVIIHTCSFKNKQDGCQVVTSNLEMDDILRGLGFGSGKSKAVDCSSAGQGTFVVKFFPTYSGLQEAQRLHNYCRENHRGRNDWDQLQSLHKNQHNVGKDPHQLQDDRHAENGRIFYGYIGIAGDLEKVDFDTRKRSFVKSRKAIEAIADGPVLGA